MKRVVAMAALVLAALVGAAQAQAATFTVGSTTDTGGCAKPPTGTTCTLRQLVNSVPAGSTISVPGGTYTLTAGELLIEKNLTITGDSPRTTSVEQNPPAGTPTARVFDIQPDPTTGVAPTVTISGLDIFFGKTVKGSVNGNIGGNVLNEGTLTLSEDQITNGQTTGGEGAGVANVNGSLTISHSMIEDNLSFASGGVGGSVGGVDTVAQRDQSAQTSIDNSTIINNTAAGGAGGISTSCTVCATNTVAVVNSTIANNDGGTATPNSGGLLAMANSTISVENSIVSGNTVGSEATASNCAATSPGAINSLGHNIETSFDCGFKASGDHQNTNPGFLTGGQADNGGNSDTIALSGTSPAVDAVPAKAAGCTGTDQRDFKRPQGVACDIGAFELTQQVEGTQFTGVVGSAQSRSTPTIDWGDGTAQSSGIVDPNTGQVTGTHTYAEAGVYHGLIHFINSDGFPGTAPFDFKVTDAPLGATATPVSAVAGTAFSGTVTTFTDGNPLAQATDFTATITWGDGTATTAGSIATNAGGGFKVTGTHTYTKTGSFNTTITIADVGGSGATANGTATVSPPRPAVTSVSPSAGPTAGGTSVTITGTNLAGASPVKFGANAATITSNTATQIVATAPAGSAGTVDITVTTPGGTSATGVADKYTYTNGPSVATISPASGPTAGGTSVTITGANLGSASGVSFGGSAATITSNTATQIVATSPAHAAGTVDITVTTAGGTSATSAADHYTYAGPPTVSGVSPASGPTLGGTIVTISGTNLGNASAVKFGNTPALVTANTPMQIVAVSPAGNAGAQDVRVTTPGGTSATGSADRFTFVPPPTVSAINPSSGPGAGGTSVTITGTTFTGATAVHFGTTAASSFTVNGDTQITAISPVGSGTPDITVTTPSGTSATGAADKYTYTVARTNVPPPSGTPTVLTDAPSVKSSSGAALEGSVDPQGLSTTAHFEYGLDSRFRAAGPIYDQSTPSLSVGSDFSSHAVSTSLTGLVPNALYHVRLVAINSAGTTFGPDATFTTKTDPPPTQPPVLGSSFDVQPVKGIVFIKINGKFIPITEVRQIPNGAVINALRGTVTLFTATGPTGPRSVALTARAKHKTKGKKKSPKRPSQQTQKGTFGGAVFKVTQDHWGLATLALVSNAFKGAPSFASCTTKHAGRATSAALSKKTLQLLHGSDNHGKFRTKGRYAAATTRGTVWSVADRCDGTLTKVSKDSVLVNDFVRHITITVRAGHSYLALARPPRHK